MTPSKQLIQLEKLRNNHDAGSISDKLVLLESLAKKRFLSADQLHRFHDILSFFRAYPNNFEILQLVERNLQGFASRSDARRYRNELASSGIAGSPIDYRFFYPMAVWLCKHWAQHLYIDWSELDEPEKLMEIIPILCRFSETSQFNTFDYSAKE